MILNFYLWQKNKTFAKVLFSSLSIYLWLESWVQDRQAENKINNATTRLYMELLFCSLLEKLSKPYILGTAHPNPWDWQHAPAPPSEHGNVTLDQRQSGIEPGFQDSGRFDDEEMRNWGGIIFCFQFRISPVGRVTPPWCLVLSPTWVTSR